MSLFNVKKAQILKLIILFIVVYFILKIFFSNFLLIKQSADIEAIFIDMKSNPENFKGKAEIIFFFVNLFSHLLGNFFQNNQVWSQILQKSLIVNQQWSLTSYLLFSFLNENILTFFIINISTFLIIFIINVLLLLFKSIFNFRDKQIEMMGFIKETTYTFLYSFLIIFSFIFLSYVGTWFIKLLYNWKILNNPLSTDMNLTIYNFSSPDNVFYNSISNTFSGAKKAISITLYSRLLSIFYLGNLFLNLTIIFIFIYLIYLIFIFPFNIILNYDLYKIKSSIIRMLLLYFLIAIFIILGKSLIYKFQSFYSNFGSLYKQLNMLLSFSIYFFPATGLIISLFRNSFIKKQRQEREKVSVI